MNKNKPTKKGRLFLRGLSIQQRLPLLICALLLCTIISLSFASYYSVKKAAMQMGLERLKTLTNNMGSMLSQSTENLVKSVKKTADNDTIRQCLASGGKTLNEAGVALLNKLRTDSTLIMVQLLDTGFTPVLSYSEADKSLQQILSSIWKPVTAPAVKIQNGMGKMFAINNRIYFPVVATVHYKQQDVGYLVSWRLLVTTPRAVEQIQKLMGKGALLYIANRDGSLWTDMIKPVSNPLIAAKKKDTYFEYTDAAGKEVISAEQSITGSDWLVMIEFSKQTMLEGATLFLKWIIIIGSLFIIAGIFIAWLMSRNITRPLKQLTDAASAISNGDYSLPVAVNRSDELGELAIAFNSMQEQVYSTRQDLEHKVEERTAQLASVNNELEAFSYSVSHDLRAPLRSIIGFTTLLEEKYINGLDDEAKRLTAVIKKNTQAMGNLIDDLLAFSRMGRHNIVKTHVATNEIIQEIITENGDAGRPVSWHIEPLPESWGDINTLRQVWVNLISNARKYSGKVTDPRIRIGALPAPGEIVFFIKDNGVGFDPKYKARLFKVFQRLHGSAEFEGTGVGLAMVEKIVSKHGGRVWVEAEKNKGACFYFSLPVK